MPSSMIVKRVRSHACGLPALAIATLCSGAAAFADDAAPIRMTPFHQVQMQD